MGILADVFVASPEDAEHYENALHAAQAQRFERVPFSGVTPPEFQQLWAMLDNADFDASRHVLEDLTAGGADESWLYRFPDGFVQGLAAIDDARLDDLVQSWCDLDELLDADPDKVLRGLAAIRQLSRSALASGRGLYLWGSI